MSKADELLLVVDEHDQPSDPLPRGQVHGANIWHRVAHIWVYNSNDELLCQQRSLKKDLAPGLWEPYFGGHLRPGEEYLGGAVREIQEELGLDIPSQDLRLWKVYAYQKPGNYEFQGIFVLEWNGSVGDVKFNDGEVEQVAWVPIKTVIQHVLEPSNTGWVYIGDERPLFEDMGWIKN